MTMRILGAGGNVELVRVKPPSVAGMFYPADPGNLKAQVGAFLKAARAEESSPPKAVIAPHAGYRYSGPVAGSAYAPLRPLAGRVKRVVLLGPAHRVGFHGVAVSSAEAFDTPLGAVPVDAEGIRLARGFPFVSEHDAAFAEDCQGRDPESLLLPARNAAHFPSGAAAGRRRRARRRGQAHRRALGRP